MARAEIECPLASADRTAWEQLKTEVDRSLPGICPLGPRRDPSAGSEICGGFLCTPSRFCGSAKTAAVLYFPESLSGSSSNKKPNQNTPLTPYGDHTLESIKTDSHWQSELRPKTVFGHVYSAKCDQQMRQRFRTGLLTSDDVRKPKPKWLLL